MKSKSNWKALSVLAAACASALIPQVLEIEARSYTSRKATEQEISQMLSQDNLSRISNSNDNYELPSTDYQIRALLDAEVPVTNYQTTLNSQTESPVNNHQTLEEKVEHQRPTSISQKGLDIIKKFEGFRERVYLDVAGKPTIGYGHLILNGENYTSVTKDEAENLLREDTSIAQEAVNEYVTAPLTQNQYDAVVSLVYNIGKGAFQESTIRKKLNARDYLGASKEFDRWNKITKNGKKVECNGLTNRRNAEEALFLEN